MVNKSRAPKRVNRNGPNADRVTIGGITDTYAGFGAKVGLQGNSFRIRVRKLGLDHPMILATREEMDAWRREQVKATWGEKLDTGDGVPMDERRKRMKAERNRRAYMRKRNQREARKAVRGKLTWQERERFTDAVVGLCSVTPEEFRKVGRHSGIRRFLLALAEADGPTPEELDEINSGELECEEESCVKTTTCERPSEGPDAGEPVESWA